jgi:2-polyprenyl-6-methoxyphenol hydroxylase-like FAD-dependent oxidoreductase
MRVGRVGIVGGSIAGCAVALAAVRSGVREVVVHERVDGGLADRGVGIAIHDDRYAELAARGYLDASMPWARLTRRDWLVRDGSSPQGRLIAVQPFVFRSYNWGSLWRGLSDRIPATVVYRPGAPVEAVAARPDGAAIRTADGREERFDLVVGADGYRSVVRRAMFPRAVPEYAGYLLWRGTFPAERLGELDGVWDETAAVTVVFDGGQLVAYRIPASRDPRSRTVNWALYAAPRSAPGPGRSALVADLAALADRHLPPYWARMLRLTPAGQTHVQLIQDLKAPAYTRGRLLLAGDAGAVARPHVGAGAVKALQDATALEAALAAEASWADALARYDAERTRGGHAHVELGRRLGQAQVRQTPDWTVMDQTGWQRWWQDQLEGRGGFGGYALVPEPGRADRYEPGGPDRLEPGRADRPQAAHS